MLTTAPQNLALTQKTSKMKNIKGISGELPWLMAIGLSSLAAARGSGGQAPILGVGKPAAWPPR